MQISVSFDTDIDFVFSMADGSTCKHTASCSASGTTISNEQCGGAKAVSLQMPSYGSDEGCNVGIHSVGFDCLSASLPSTTTTIISIATSSSLTTTTTSVVVTTPSTSTTLPTLSTTTTPVSSWYTATTVSTTTPVVTTTPGTTTPSTTTPNVVSSSINSWS